jgi:hypothetical protein
MQFSIRTSDSLSSADAPIQAKRRSVQLRSTALLLLAILSVFFSPALLSAQDAPEQGSPEQGSPDVAAPPNHSPTNPRTWQRRGVPPNLVRPQPDAQQQQQEHQPAPTPAPRAAAPAPEATPSPSEAVAAPAAVPDSMLQQPASRAQVKVSNGMLSVQAENSNLSQVLRDIGSATGMKVEGLGRDERVFGHYGPAPPRDVLTALLDGAGYNVLMVGDVAGGAPKQLILSQRKGSANTAAPPPDPNAQPASEDEDVEPDAPPDQEGPAPAPEEVTPPPTAPEGEVRTPQQLLEQLQRLHQDQPPNQAQPAQSPPEQ